jgi:hypothetical protein
MNIKELLRIVFKKIMPMLLNLSNHPSAHWPQEQMDAAIQQYSSVQDLPFPQIDPEADSDQIDQLVEKFVHKIMKINPSAVHIMGEMTFTYKLVTRLKDIGLPCIASTTQRITQDNGNVKTSVFKFIQFRSY